MKIVIAPDSFKDSLRAADICRAIAAGCQKAEPTATLELIPLSDGGEGLIQAIAHSGQYISCTVTGPDSSPVNAQYLISEKDSAKTAIIEMAAAAGLELLPPKKRNPINTTTFGVGELILHAWNNGCRNFYIGMGGSATIDCGCGLAQALGIKFFDQNDQLITKPLTPALNKDIKCICTTDIKIDTSKCSFTAISDVNNTLLGNSGAAYVFGPQKGADHNQILIAEQANTNAVTVIENNCQHSLRDIPGTGAAGGLAIAIIAFLNGTITSGIDAVLKETNFQQRIKDADLIITGEGAIDKTTIDGKVISGVLAYSAKIPVYVLCGSINSDLTPLYKLGLTAAYSICPGPCSLADSIKNTAANLNRTAEQLIRTITQAQTP